MGDISQHQENNRSYVEEEGISYRRRESCGLEEAYPYGEEEQQLTEKSPFRTLIEMINAKEKRQESKWW